MKKSAIFGLIVIAVAIAILITTFGSASTYGSIADAKKTNDELNIVGHLDKSKELYYDAVRDANYFTFYIQDKNGEECKVEFTGTKPQDFERSEQIVMVGRMNGKVFHASHITMKCPSKYNNNKVETTFNAKGA
jgi:cytochrome c-type biogenesis protein CcmE